MKFKKILCLFIFLQFLLFAAHSFAHDTDLYVGEQSSVEPNVLIIFDKSGSMNDPLSGKWQYCPGEYTPGYAYPQPPNIPNVDRYKVYEKSSYTNNQWFPSSGPRVYKSTVGEVPCVNAQNQLNAYGDGLFDTGKPDNTNCSSGTSRALATGNYLRYTNATAENKATCNPKLGIAKQVIKDFLTTVVGVRVGVMVFNGDPYEGGHILKEIVSLGDLGSTARTTLKSSIDSISGGGYTPLAETLYEAGLYFQLGPSYFNSGTTYGVTYPDPMKDTDGSMLYCRKNYVIVMTDGISTEDRNDVLKTINTPKNGDMNNDQREPPGAANDPGFNEEGSDFLDDVAKYLYDTDLRSDLEKTQNIVTYTIGFALDMSDPDEATKAKDLLQRAATLSHGKFYTTDGIEGLADAFTSILNEVLAKTSSFVAPIVPVSKMERTTAGDKIYLAFFRPNQSGMWSGNIKKYGVQQMDDASKGLVVGDLTDSTGSKALDADGSFYPSSKSFWTTNSHDGGEVEIGGVGEILKNRTATYPSGTPVQDSANDPVTFRNIYTLLPGSDSDLDETTAPFGTSFDLTNSWNAFTVANSKLTKSSLGLSLFATDTERKNLINFIRGIDVYDDNLNGSTTDKRDWMLGSFLHSRPFVINYADRTVIYAGANDGMLHAFDDATGEELWGFIPPNLLNRLQELHTVNPGIFVDGSAKAYVDYTYDVYGKITGVNKAILIFGLRRGGNYYYALDVTNPLVPKYAYRIYKGKKGYFNNIGQTWSTPVIGKVAYGTGEKWVAIFGGGYDENQDEDNPGNDTIGRGIYIADVLTGAYVWGKSAVGADPIEQTMTYCIPSDIAAIDLNGDGRIERLYVGDTNSRIWRFNLVGSNPDSWTVKKIFEPDTAEKRKIFYPPDVTFEKDNTGEYEMLFFGTGNREDPTKYRALKNRLYAFKDKNASGTLGKTDLVEVTLFYQKSASEQQTMLDNIKSKYGWYIELENDKKVDVYGEKCLATPVVYAKTAYFTTFAPTVGDVENPCFIGEGTARIYAMNYATGEAVFNFDLSNDTGGTVVKAASDRSKQIGTAIPSGVVITVIGGKVTAYIGVGGGVYRPELSSVRSMFPVNWKLVF